MHGYEARLPVDIIFGSRSKERHSLCDYVDEVQDRLEATFQKVREKTGQEVKRQKTYYDRNTLEEGKLVWLWNRAMAICHRVQFIGVCNGVLDVRITPYLFAVGCFVAL